MFMNFMIMLLKRERFAFYGYSVGATNVKNERVLCILIKFMISTTGLCVYFAIPRAKNPADRSSKTVSASIRALRDAAKVRGVERAPGEVTIVSTPKRANTSIVKHPQTEFSLEHDKASKGVVSRVITY